MLLLRVSVRLSGYLFSPGNLSAISLCWYSGATGNDNGERVHKMVDINILVCMDRFRNAMHSLVKIPIV